MFSTTKNLRSWSLLALALIGFLGFTSAFAFSNPDRSATVLNFFDGKIIAKVSWMSQPTTAKVTQLKVELLDSANHPYDIDSSLVSVGLFMPAMPDMGVEEQNVVFLNDASGNPIPGSFVATDVNFSMEGEWEVRLTLPSPKDQKQNEMKKFSVSVK